MPRWELINPSDPYTFDAEFEVAALVTIALGGGQYGAREVDGDGYVPIMFRGGAERYSLEFGRTPNEGLDALEEQVVQALDTLLIGDAGDRATMDAVLAAIASAEDRVAARKAYHERKRSSMNNIGARASAIAEQLRARAESTA